MAYTNQFTFKVTARLEEIIFDGKVKFGDDSEHSKTVALFSCEGPEQQSDLLTVVCFDKVSDVVYQCNNGQRFDLECKIQSREISPKNGGAKFWSTEVLCYFARPISNEDRRERKSERQQNNRETYDQRKTQARPEERDEKKRQRGGDNPTGYRTR